MINNKQIILASSSPRRLQLLKQINLKPQKIISPNIDENKVMSNSIQKRPVEIAYNKALYVKKQYKNNKYYILAADTLVYRAGKIFEKTDNKNTIKEYLKNLSGKKHYVYGGICIIGPKGQVLKKLVTTEVFFKKISREEISNENFLIEGIGKAGGYAIQGLGTILIRKIKGSYSNVVGLSLYDTLNMLKGISWKVNKNICFFIY